MTGISLTPSLLISIAIEQATSLYGRLANEDHYTLNEIDFIVKWTRYADSYPSDYGYILH